MSVDNRFIQFKESNYQETLSLIAKADKQCLIVEDDGHIGYATRFQQWWEPFKEKWFSWFGAKDHTKLEYVKSYVVDLQDFAKIKGWDTSEKIENFRASLPLFQNDQSLAIIARGETADERNANEKSGSIAQNILNTSTSEDEKSQSVHEEMIPPQAISAVESRHLPETPLEMTVPALTARPEITQEEVPLQPAGATPEKRSLQGRVTKEPRRWNLCKVITGLAIAGFIFLASRGASVLPSSSNQKNTGEGAGKGLTIPKGLTNPSDPKLNNSNIDPLNSTLFCDVTSAPNTDVQQLTKKTEISKELLRLQSEDIDKLNYLNTDEIVKYLGQFQSEDIAQAVYEDRLNPYALKSLPSQIRELLEFEKIPPRLRFFIYTSRTGNYGFKDMKVADINSLLELGKLKLYGPEVNGPSVLILLTADFFSDAQLKELKVEYLTARHFYDIFILGGKFDLLSGEQLQAVKESSLVHDLKKYIGTFSPAQKLALGFN